MRSLYERLESKIERMPESGCWVWMGNLTHDGYPYMHVMGGKKYVHRVCYELYRQSKIPEGMTLDHVCRVRCCVNPSHMEAMTLRENIARGNYGWRGRLTHCKRGHPLSGDNLYVWKKARICKTCRRDYVIARGV